MIQQGQNFPSVKLSRLGEGGMEQVDTSELFAAGKSVLFAVPGAFTPTCSKQHLPGFVQHAQAMLDKGVDRIVCVSVNDAFVMKAWGDASNVGDKVALLADGNAELAEALGLTMDGSGFGMGKRSQRFAIIVDSGVVSSVFVDEPGKFEVSSAEHILSQL